jgi:folate-binding protein YgfZ
VFSENLGLSEIGERWSHLVVVGPLARAAVANAGLAAPEDYATARAELDGNTVFVLGHDGLSKSGVSIIVPGNGAERVWKKLRVSVLAAGGSLSGDLAMEARRVLLGLPENGAELDESHNPLEAGLWDAVSFDKGCYVGQEVVARLRTYDKVSSDLRGFSFAETSEVPVPKTSVRAGSRTVGEITSALLPPGRPSPIALGYVKREHAAPGTQLEVGELCATVVELPFSNPSASR